MDKTLKKNKAMRAALIVLVATLLTTCMVSSTFAKYTATNNGSDSARIARWGIGLASNTDLNLFDGSYTYKTSTGDSVSATTNVIAPGTSKTATISFTGDKPEVAYNLKLGLTGPDFSADIENNTGIVWTLKLPSDSSARTYSTFASMKTAVDAYSVNKAANVDPDFSVSIGWSWPFEASGDKQPATQDVKDTALGNASTLASTGTLTLTATATQID